MTVNDILLRIRSNWRLKVLLGAVLTTAIWGTYLFVQRHAVFPVTAMKVTFVDQLIPFVPSTVYLYESLWLLMPIAPWLMVSKVELTSYTRGLTGISIVGFLVFVLYPTSSPRPECALHANTLYQALIRVDNELNAFPSLHAAFAVFHGAWCNVVFSADRWRIGARWVIWIWATAIVASTLLTKQHVLVDAIAGSLLGFGGYIIGRRFSNLPQPKPNRGT